MVSILKIALSLMTVLFGGYYISDAIKNRSTYSKKPWSGLLGTGFITNCLDTLGIGSFATSTTYFRMRTLVRDELIPGSLNVGYAFPSQFVQA